MTDGDETIAGFGPPVGSGRSDAAGGRTTVIELRGAISLIERFPALAGVDLTVQEGEIILLRGPNGAGKSTLLRLCAGLAPLNGGEGVILGHDLSSRRERRELRRQTGLLAHATFLYDELTVEENLLFWARANRLDLASVEPVLDRLALANRLRDVRVAHLSAGQRRRASLAVLVCRRPRLWLLDEPHAGLDVNGRDFVDALIKHAVAFGGTVLLASHDFDRAGEIATRTVVVAGGQIQDVDPFDAPAPAGARGEPAVEGGPAAGGPVPDAAMAQTAGGPVPVASGARRPDGNRSDGTVPPGGLLPPEVSTAAASTASERQGDNGIQAGGAGAVPGAGTGNGAAADPRPTPDTAAGSGPGSRWRARRRAAAEPVADDATLGADA